MFIDGLQTVLLFTDNEQIIELIINVSFGSPSSSNSITRRLQIGIPDVGISIVNDLKREELVYITLNKSEVQWVKTMKTRMKPFPSNIQARLEEIYRTNPNGQTKYQINHYRVLSIFSTQLSLIFFK